MGNGATADGPDGGEAFVGEEFTVRGDCFELPGKFAGVCGDAVEEAVVGAEENPVMQSHWREADGAVGEELPELFSGAGVEGGDLVFAVGREKQALAEYYRFVTAIELEADVIESGLGFVQNPVPD